MKYIFVTGGVCSSLGKGLTAAALGMLLENRGLKVALLKLDPYLNVDPGTMNPFQHGEVYVTDDGAETDLDLGHYHRYTDSPLSKASNATSGQIYNTVIKRERKGDYLGNTVQVIPHITDEIKKRITDCSAQDKDISIVIVEIGGTVGDIESLPFLEAIRQFRNENPNDCINTHLTYVPYIKAAGEVKTKPSQHSVQVLREIGIMPDIMLLRCENSLDQDVKDKISLFCNVPKEAVIEEVDVENTIYEVPLKLHEQKLDEIICKKLNIPTSEVDFSKWKEFVDVVNNPKGSITIGVVGKYVQHQDAYKSVFEALSHGAIKAGYKLKIRRFEADKLEESPNMEAEIEGCDGYLVPGGFGERGWEGKIATAKYCRQNNIPYFGICLGMQVMAVEYARNVANINGANSTEIQPGTERPIISLLSEQENVVDIGGTMRLGAYPCQLSESSKAFSAYGKRDISERHRHRYEFNNSFRGELEKSGLIFSGVFEKAKLVEIIEAPKHPWMVGVQFHPEFKSKPTEPHPLFVNFIDAAIKNQAITK
ncbi:MAG: CTP synthase [Chlamydiota bacterium]|nr:CTP synthase [Chlamydiota bacterium]